MRRIEVGLRAAITALQPTFVIEDAESLMDGQAFRSMLRDPASGMAVPLLWHVRDEIANDSPESLAKFIGAFARNGVDSLQFVISGAK